MGIGGTFVIVAFVVLAIWMLFEFKKFRHKVWAIILILIIVFGYVSFNSVIKGKDIDLKSASGLKQAGGLYLTWFGHAFSNMKVITSNAIDMDWKGNETNETGGGE